MDSFLSPVNNSNDTSGENMANKGTKAGAAKHSQSSSKGKSLPSNAPVTVESENDSGVENDKESLPDCHEVYVKVCYRGSPMAGMKVDNRLGCRIFFGPCVASSGVSEEEHARLFGGRHLTQLSLPPPGQAQSILPSIWYLLDSLQRGIILEVISNDIYATRLCHANVYWGAPAHLGDTCALERGVRTRIFNYQLFLQIYKHFRDDPDRTALASQPPAPSVLLGVGQPWGPERQLDNNLVMISVTHCLAEHLMELLHRHRWETQRPFDTDYLMIDLMNDDDKLAMAKTRLTLDRLGLEKDEHRADAASTDAAGKLTPLNLSSLPVGM
ncbi:interferon regulatory factor 5-like [Sycon ciliatum]|uniref:interferon regulatory factor 5-like n=1 Tax=Sycon ciliatum TaxID=27933 RepID=UPI0031F64C13